MFTTCLAWLQRNTWHGKGGQMSAHRRPYCSEGKRHTVTLARDTEHAKLLAEFSNATSVSDEFVCRVASLHLQIDILESFVPATAVGKLDVQMLSIESKPFDGRQQSFRFSPFLLAFVRADCFCPTFVNAMAKAEPAVVLQMQYGLGEVLVDFDLS